MISLSTKPSQSITIDGSGISGNTIVNGEVTNHHHHTNQFLNSTPASRIGAIQELLEGIADMEDRVAPIPTDVTPYDVRDKVTHNSLKNYSTYYDQYMDFRNIIVARLDFLSSNGQPTIKNKILNTVKRIYIHTCSVESNNDTIVLKICEKIEKGLPPNLAIDDISYVPAVVFYVFSECHIFEKPFQLQP